MQLSLFYIVLITFAVAVTSHFLADDDTPLYEACCSKCMTQQIGGVDVANMQQCQEKQTPCCFNCSSGSVSQPEYGSSGKAGIWNKITWKGVNKVTYIVVKEEDSTSEKTDQPTFTSSPAEKDGDNFHICTINKGTIYFRAFKDEEGCIASMEKSLPITEVSESSCPDFTSSQDLKTPSPSSSDGGNNGNDPDEKNSSTNNQVSCTGNSYASDGKCVCETGYAGENCTDWPSWRWGITIAGGLAAVISIAVSAHAFMHRRKISKARSNDREDRDTEADIVLSSPVPKMEILKIDSYSEKDPIHSPSYYNFSSDRNINKQKSQEEVTL